MPTNRDNATVFEVAVTYGLQVRDGPRRGDDLKVIENAPDRLIMRQTSWFMGCLLVAHIVFIAFILWRLIQNEGWGTEGLCCTNRVKVEPSPSPRRIYPMGSVTGMPRAV